MPDDLLSMLWFEIRIAGAQSREDKSKEGQVALAFWIEDRVPFLIRPFSAFLFEDERRS
jgi:hypothetical protein